jgi:hypothetical protein
MVKQVITVHQGGAISGLERPNLLDFKQLGKAKIKRTSDIVWSEEQQKFYVYFIHLETFLTDENDKLLFFTDYEDAKRAEVAHLDALRLQGKIPKLTEI